MFDYITTICSTLLGFYLPIPDMSVRITVSMATAQIMSSVISYLSITFFPFLQKYLFRGNKVHISIQKNNPIYEQILSYLYHRFIKNIKGCNLQVENGKYKMFIDELHNGYIIDSYQNKSIYVSFNHAKVGVIRNESKNQDQTESKGVDDLFVETQTDINLLKEYVAHIVQEVNQKNDDHRTIHIYRSVGKINKKDENVDIHWQHTEHITNKNIDNTIVSNMVKTNLLDDVDYFIKNEKYYIEHGIPYKRNYVLYGEPGTGKTSLIKVLAAKHNIPIFIINFTVLKSESQFSQLIDEIEEFTLNKLHMVIFEDIEKSGFFNRYDDRPNYNLINSLDGVDEHYGRINILTANDLSVLERDPALLRAGRIDRIIYVTYCTHQQLIGILQLYFGEFKDKLNENIVITPSILIQIIHCYNDINKVLKIINHIVKFNKFSLEKNMENIEQLLIPNTSEQNIETDTNGIQIVNNEPKINIEYCDNFSDDKINKELGITDETISNCYGIKKFHRRYKKSKIMLDRFNKNIEMLNEQIIEKEKVIPSLSQNVLKQKALQLQIDKLKLKKIATEQKVIYYDAHLESSKQQMFIKMNNKVNNTKIVDNTKLDNDAKIVGNVIVV